MLILGVYEDDNYEECRFVGTYKEIAKEFKIREDSLRCAVSRKNKLQGRKRKRYLICKLYEEEDNLC